VAKTFFGFFSAQQSLSFLLAQMVTAPVPAQPISSKGIKIISTMATVLIEEFVADAITLIVSVIVSATKLLLSQT
jgi:hypothetical protein